MNPPADDRDADRFDRIRSGDVDALAAHLDHHREPLIGFIRSIASERLLTMIEVEDLFQEVSTTAFTTLSTAPLDQYTVDSWLQQISRRRVIDAHRHHFTAARRDAGRHAAGRDDEGNAGANDLGNWLVASITSPSAAVSQDVRLHRMRIAVDSLPDEQQTAIRMRYLENKSTAEIAAAIGKSDVATRVLLSRCVRSLEKTLADVKPTRD
ncbi:RNA polymerase sigma factor [Allorhodopirellula heiligendammensis]|uniref:RNA polymerase sigma factor n=1 Tax=Allorhodopirellula heiligendammensis TaxID=2714739 RepID=A0A5C6BY10_9BACT|nr:sigma-70 family RNA polymerase sigma factor [Allorhodopirellula heiligendammensis]TWU16136.1 RNA polymerase sigma factor [Allorhodopirellula heiligendammensis]